MTIEEIKKILEDNNYSLTYHNGHLIIGWAEENYLYDIQFECKHNNDTVLQAYNHYLRENHIRKMETIIKLLKEIV